MKLKKAGKERKEGVAFRAALNRRMHELLLEAQDTPGLTLVEAAALLGITRQTAYRILDEEGPKL
ncbi:MAG TPA: helix-turn-helix domain-containing protein [Solirubrobacterales bacterium]|nr:helix-turn-helix domain-containing protein [Solirubrobacterales bacterium]